MLEARSSNLINGGDLTVFSVYFSNRLDHWVIKMMLQLLESLEYEIAWACEHDGNNDVISSLDI
jgi:hypothetical protein